MPLVVPPTGSPIGFFVASPGRSTPPSPVLADNLHPETREFVDLFAGLDPTDAKVQVALATARGTGAAVADDGNEFHLITKMTDAVDAQIVAEARRALQRLVQAREIALVKVEVPVFPSDQTAELQVTYRNLRTNDPNARRVAKRLPSPIEVG